MPTDFGAGAARRSRDQDLGQLVRSSDRQPAQVHGVEQLEDRDVRADAEREGYGGHDGKARIEFGND